MSFREKLLDFKRRLSDRKMYSIVIAVIAAVALWGLYQYKHSAQLRQQLDNQYNRAFFDMTGYVKNVEVLLVKSLITSSPQKTATTLQEAWRQANMAQANLGQLPISTQTLSSTSKFLTQVGDLSYSLNNQNLQGKPLTDQQYKTIEQLQNYAVKLGRSLNSLQNEIQGGRMKWGELSAKGPSFLKKASTSLPSKEFESIDKTFQSYPTLIYDGPFSDHVAKAEPKGITGELINATQAKQKVQVLFKNYKVKSITETGAQAQTGTKSGAKTGNTQSKSNNDKTSNNGAPIKTFGFKVLFSDRPEADAAYIDITEKGGHIYWMLINRAATSSKLSIDSAKEAGRKFLETQGYPGMVDTYYVKEDNTATINYAYKQGNVVVYPDLIKIKIALDNGEILGMEGKGYLSAHTQRSIPKPKITQQQARASINNRMKILSSDLAIIPTDYKTELFVYEFKGKLNNKDFLVYINAETGKEENILMIIDTDKGILTI
ncbi:MAG: germination protein YpeB [Bacillota bacterium]|nr:germination protein YpeB [Bacillota bacterium]